MSFINFFSVSQSVTVLGGTCPLWNVINDNANKESSSFQKLLIFIIKMLHVAEDNADLVCQFVIRISGVLLAL